MKIVCEIISLAIYRYCKFNALYITLKNVQTGEIFNGKALMEKIPACVVERLVVVERGSNVIGKQVLKQRFGKDSEINRYDLLSVSEYIISAE